MEHPEPPEEPQEPQEPQPPEPPPIPEASGVVSHCPHCGHRLMLDASHCPHCGTRLAAGTPALSIASTILLAMGALIFGSVGTCSLLGIVSALFTPHGFSALAASFLLPGAVASYLAILCVRPILESVRSRRDRP